MYYAARFGAPPDSDVEILSNPSISSIEVLDQFSRHSSRKHSEDRRFLMNEQKQQLQLLQQQPAPQQHQFQLPNHTQYALLQPQQAVATSDHPYDSQSIDTLGSGWRTSTGGKLTDCNQTSSSNNSDVEELNDETTAGLMHRQTSTDDLDAMGTGCTIADDHANGRTGKTHRKTVLSGMNLTESSSSGSVTDSICTAYEQQQTTDGKGSRDTITTSTDGLITTTTQSSNKVGLTTSTIATPVANDNKIVCSTLNEADEKNLSQSKVQEMSTLTTMIGGEYINEPTK